MHLKYQIASSPMRISMFSLPIRTSLASRARLSHETSSRSMGSWLGSLFRRSASPPRQFPTEGFALLDSNEKVEEENWDWYSADAYYPARIGQVFESRYQVLGKFGYGVHSTAWLARDLSAHRYVTLKICERERSSADREIAAYECLNALTTAHKGAIFVRQLFDVFKIPNAGHEHQCLVHEPLGMSTETLRQVMPGGRLSADVLKSIVKYLLLTLDFLHTEARMIHADIQANNMHLRIEDVGILETFERNEMKDPSPREIDGDRVIYESRGLVIPKTTGPPVLCDFGEARHGKAFHTGEIQPRPYRAPDVILDMPWSYSVDIWNVGVMAWDLFEDRQLFSLHGPDDKRLSECHLAEMVAVLGPPPPEFLQRSETSGRYFESDGTWRAPTAIPDKTLKSSEKCLEGEEKILFLDCMRKMLQWMPEHRYTAKQMLEDPWLKAS